jgi:putative DNA primase/helicase
MVQAGEQESKKPRTKADLDCGDAKPQAVAVDPAGIPGELAALPQWVVWQYEWRDGKWTKVPIDPKNGRKASSTNPSTWSTLAEALKSHHPDKTDGIGFVFAADDPFCGIDVDDCLDPNTGEVVAWAVPILDRFPTYAEISPSRTGIKLFIRGQKKPEWKCKRNYESGKVEIYDRKRFFAVTGQRFGNAPTLVSEEQSALEWLYYIVWGQQYRRSTSEAYENKTLQATVDASDTAIIEAASRAKNGADFLRLWGGDTSAYGGDDSSADLALCNYLAFYARTPERIDQLFRKSGLMREKWNRQDYREGTIALALEGKTEFWTPAEKRGRIIFGKRAVETNGHASSNNPPPGDPPDGNEGETPELIQESKPIIHLTDRGNALRLVLRYGQEIRHCLPWKKWLVWEESRWRIDATAGVTRAAKETVAYLF